VPFDCFECLRIHAVLPTSRFQLFRVRTISIKVETNSSLHRQNASFACIGCLHSVLWEIENSISSGFVTIEFGYSFIRWFILTEFLVDSIWSHQAHHIRQSLISSTSSSLWRSHRCPRFWDFFRFRVDSSVDSSWTMTVVRSKCSQSLGIQAAVRAYFFVSIIDENQLGCLWWVRTAGQMTSDESGSSLIFISYLIFTFIFHYLNQFSANA